MKSESATAAKAGVEGLGSVRPGRSRIGHGLGLIAVLCLVLAGGCGRKGALYFPDKPADQPAPQERPET